MNTQPLLNNVMDVTMKFKSKVSYRSTWEDSISDDASATDYTDGIKTEPELNVQLLLTNVMDVTTKCESKVN